MIREWIKEYGEYPFWIEDKKGNKIEIPILEDLTEKFELIEKIYQLQRYLDMCYGFYVDVKCEDPKDLPKIYTKLIEIEKVLEDDNR